MDTNRNLELMQTLDDAWSAQDWDTFAQRHKPDAVVRWPGQPPTHGVDAHRAESIQLFETFPDNGSDSAHRCHPLGWSARVTLLSLWGGAIA